MKNRYLFWFCITFIAVTAFWMLFESTVAFLGVFSFVVIALVTGLVWKKAKIAAICVVAAAAVSLLWQTFFFGRAELPKELFKKTTGIVAEVTDYSGMSKNGNSIVFKAKLDCEGKSINAIVYTTESVSDLAPGDVIRMDATFREFENTESFSAETYYKSRYIDVSAFAENVEVIEKNAGSGIAHIPQYLAKQFRAKIDEIYPDETAGFLKSLLTGNKDDLPEDLKEGLKATGLSHTVSVSGMHISFLISLVVFFTKNKYLKLLCIPVMFVFALMVGAPQSALRAVIMQTLLIASAIGKREYDSLTAISVAACILVMINPYCVTDIAFILSFMATLGIIVLSRRISDFLIGKFGIKKWGKLKKIVYSILITASLSISATLFTAPILAYTYGSVSLISIFANILLIWLVTVIFILGFISVMIGFVFLPLAKGVAFIVSMCAEVTMTSVAAMAKLPFSVVATENPILVLLITFICMVAIYAIAVGREKLRIRYSAAATAVALVCSLIVLSMRTAAPTHEGLRFDVLDVGQGQCVVVTAGEACVVIDCGGNEDAANTAISHLYKNGIENIDALVFTHAHADHSNGGSYLVESVETQRVYMPYTDRDNSAFRSILEKAGENKGVYVKENTKVNVGKIEMDILTLPQGSEENENGIVVVICDGDYECVITGDIPGASEKLIVGMLPDAESYIVGHHGSKTSTSLEFLNRILPELSVISVGENNSYGHPSSTTLTRLEKIGSNIARTDVDGTVTFYSRQVSENEYKH